MATEPKDNLSMMPRAAMGLLSVAQQREIAEVQAAMIVARMNPRKYQDCIDAIKNACMRPELAKKATYAYAKGGTDIRGPSIRLAEVMAQNWGNIDFGMRELEKGEEESTVETFCWDLEKNVRERRIFQVPHVRYSKEKGNVVLSDPRDIYENTANMGARRMRACILGVIPREVQDEAVKQCQLTLENHIKVTPELIRSLIEKFAEFKVTKEQLEARIQRKIEAIQPAQVFALGEIYNSLKDGMSESSEWFRHQPEKGTINPEDLKPGPSENRGHGNENLDQVGKQAPPEKPQETPKEKGKTNPSAKKTTTQPAGNPNYSETESDPFAPGGDLFGGRESGEEG